MRKINFDNKILDKISDSLKITEEEKLNFLKYIAYLTPSEQKELAGLF
ncbi:hypothetical protein HG430_004265 [Candidatus Gracilibacteria bacterium]|nr:hypothetical protein [Candidatus Gracilibacteria bacterium]